MVVVVVGGSGAQDMCREHQPLSYQGYNLTCYTEASRLPECAYANRKVNEIFVSELPQSFLWTLRKTYYL